MSQSLRIALLSYRSKTHCGGQGVYVRHLSRGLVELGHHVEVFSGPPYPDGLDPRVVLRQVPSLDLYREPDPFRVPRPSEIRDRIDLLELATMWTAGFPEPRTFGLRTARILLDRSRLRRGIRRGARQPEPGHRPAEDRGVGHARGGHRAPPDHPRPRSGPGRFALVAQATGAPLVRIRRDAEARRPADPGPAHRLDHVGHRHRRRLRGTSRPVARRSAGCRHVRVRADAGTPGARPHHRDRQRRRAAQGCRRTCCRPWRNCAPSATSNCNWWRGWKARARPRS